MATLELVERLKEKANVSYEDAKAALDACDDDLLEAVIYLEKQGKINAPANGGHYTSQHEQARQSQQTYTHSASPRHSFGDTMSRFGRWCAGLIRKSCVNLFEVHHGGRRMLCVPVLLLVILLLACFWVTVPLLIIGLCFGCRYRFVGEDAKVEEVKESAVHKVNEVMDTAAATAVNVVDQIKLELDGLSGPKDK